MMMRPSSCEIQLVGRIGWSRRGLGVEAKSSSCVFDSQFQPRGTRGAESFGQPDGAGSSVPKRILLFTLGPLVQEYQLYDLALEFGASVSYEGLGFHPAVGGIEVTIVGVIQGCPDSIRQGLPIERIEVGVNRGDEARLSGTRPNAVVSARVSRGQC